MASPTRNSSSLRGEATIPRLIIAGSRSITRFALLLDALRTALGEDAAGRVLEVVSGGARGVDTLALRWAHEHRIPARVFRARWKQHGKRAGLLRNEEMAAYATHLLALWDGQSPGTRHMVSVARRRGLVVHLHRIATTPDRGLS